MPKVQLTPDLGITVRMVPSDQVAPSAPAQPWSAAPSPRYSLSIGNTRIVQSTPDYGLRVRMQRTAEPEPEPDQCKPGRRPIFLDTFRGARRITDRAPDIGPSWSDQRGLPPGGLWDAALANLQGDGPWRLTGSGGVVNLRYGEGSGEGGGDPLPIPVLVPAPPSYLRWTWKIRSLPAGSYTQHLGRDIWAWMPGPDGDLVFMRAIDFGVGCFSAADVDGIPDTFWLYYSGDDGEGTDPPGYRDAVAGIKPVIGRTYTIDLLFLDMALEMWLKDDTAGLAVLMYRADISRYRTGFGWERWNELQFSIGGREGAVLLQAGAVAGSDYTISSAPNVLLAVEVGTIIDCSGKIK